jgi:peptidoglycan/LPS O-acetylase OafA/YrhL
VVFDLKRSIQIGHLWSLSLEEQFYSAIAIVVFLYRRLTKTLSLQKFIVLISLLIISWSIIAKIYILRTGDVGASWVNLYFRTDLRADTFFVGSLTAVYRQNHSVKPAKLVGATFLPSVFLLVIYMITANTDDAFNYRGGLTIVAIASAFVILAASYPGTLADKLLSSRPLKQIGLLSYSIYLIHMPVFNALSPNNSSIKFQSRLPIAFIVIFLYSVASYIFLEKPLTKVRRKFLS